MSHSLATGKAKPAEVIAIGKAPRKGPLTTEQAKQLNLIHDAWICAKRSHGIDAYSLLASIPLSTTEKVLATTLSTLALNGVPSRTLEIMEQELRQAYRIN